MRAVESPEQDGGKFLPGAETPHVDGDRRQSQRRRAILSGRIADFSGSQVLECVIRNIGASGAQIRLRNARALPDEVYLVDIKNHVAYEADVIHKQSDVAGLSFKQGYSLNKALPVHLRFLRRLLIDARLRQIEILRTRGFSLEDAVRTAGATRAMYHLWRAEDDSNTGQARRVKRSVLLRERIFGSAPNESGLAPRSLAAEVRSSLSCGKEDEVAGAGLAALAVLPPLLGTLLDNQAVSAMQVKQLVDDALLMLEQGQGDSPVPEATRLARHCVERLLAISSAGGSDSNGLSGPQKDDRFE